MSNFSQSPGTGSTEQGVAGPRREQGRTKFSHICMESLAWLTMLVSPWWLGATEPLPIFVLICSISVITLLWLWNSLVSGEFRIRFCHMTMGLLSVLVLGMIQLIPLPMWCLMIISPGTSSLYGELLPLQHESLAVGGNASPWGFHLGHTLSLYPEATRLWIVNFIPVVLLFTVLRHSVANLAAAQRCAVLCVLNGAVLSVFAVVQFFTSEPNVLYWSIQTRGTGFGPFVNRNDYAFYINLCLGWALALLLVRIKYLVSPQQGRLRFGSTQLSRVVLGDAPALWLLFAMAFMLAAAVFANSRGGFLSLLSGLLLSLIAMVWQWKQSRARAGVSRNHLGETVVGALPMRYRAPRENQSFNSALMLLLGACVAAGCLVVWYGWDRVQARLETITSGSALDDARVYVLTHAWPAISRFTVFGTGMGTFEFIEPIYFHTARDVTQLYQHAHNDYLEDVLEGGVLRLGLRVGVLVFLFLACFRNIHYSTGPIRGSMAVGLLFSLTTLTVHSVFDFALFTPSIAVLAVVLVAFISSLDEWGDEPAVGKRSPWLYPALVGLPSTRGFNLMVMVAGVLVVVGLVRQAANVYQATQIWDSLQTAENGVKRAPLSVSQVVDAFNQLLVDTPHDARLHSEIGHFYLSAFQVSGGDMASRQSSLRMDGIRRATLATGLQHALRARDLCPLLPEPHVKLGLFHQYLDTPDLKSTYLARAKLMAPASAPLWFLCGEEELRDGQVYEAFASWRHCLMLAADYRKKIAELARQQLSREQIQQILPDDPALLVTMVDLIYPPNDSEWAAQRRDLLMYAFRGVPELSDYSTPEEVLAHVMIRRGLGQLDEAEAIVDNLLQKEPNSFEGRATYIRLLIEQRKWAEAREQLTLLKALHGSRREIDPLIEELATGELQERARPQKRPTRK